MHQTLKAIILREGKNPESKLVYYRALKRKLLFAVESTGFQNKYPKLDTADTAVAKVYRKSDLIFQDMVFLKDRLDRKMDALLKQA